MGWDAHSSIEVDWDKGKIKNPDIDKLFKEASEYVMERARRVDGFLRLGSLDCSACAKMLEKATGLKAWTETPWDKEFVRDVNKNADWSFEFNHEEAWAYWSARIFLETCAKNNLSIIFSS